MSWNIEIIANKNYPPSLLEIPESPKTLYLAGKLPSVNNFKYLTVVGARKYSSYGREAVEKIISGLAGYPVAIVSGLALGIDTLAHQAALAAKLPTLAIPGSGLDRSVLYPAVNRKLAEKILENGGGLLSEYEPVQPATLYTFPRRNRLMAGLTQATLVVEAGKKSGTLITARLATEYNRDVLAVPGSIFSPNSYGPNWLIGRGATPITDSDDLLRALNFDPAEKENADISGLSTIEQKIYELLQTEPLSRDEIIFRAKRPIHEINPVLSLMEIKGLIKETMGKFYISR